MTAPNGETAPATGAEDAVTPAIDETDWKAEAEKYKAEVDKWKAHSRKNEERAKAAAAAGKTTTPPAETDEDPRVKAATADAAEARIEARLTKLAAAHSPEALALIDSIAFREAVDDLDFTGLADFDEQVTDLIKKRLGDKKKPPPAATGSSGGEFAGGSGSGAPISEAQLAKMTPEQIAKAFEEGRLKHML